MKNSYHPVEKHHPLATVLTEINGAGPMALRTTTNGGFICNKKNNDDNEKRKKLPTAMDTVCARDHPLSHLK